MNKKKLFPLALVPLAATSLQAQSNVQTERTDKHPNIILFMVDDMGWQDTSLPFWTQKTHYNELHRVGELILLAYAWVNIIPWRANRSMFGVSYSSL